MVARHNVYLNWRADLPCGGLTDCLLGGWRRRHVKLNIGQARRLGHLVMNGTDVGVWVGLGNVELEVPYLPIEVCLGVPCRLEKRRLHECWVFG